MRELHVTIELCGSDTFSPVKLVTGCCTRQGKKKGKKSVIVLISTRIIERHEKRQIRTGSLGLSVRGHYQTERADRGNASARINPP